MKNSRPFRPCRYRRLFVVATAAGLAVSAFAGSPDPTDAIRAVMDRQVQAWNRGDIDGFMEGYARSTTTEFVSGDKITRGWDTVRAQYRRKYDTPGKMGKLTFSEIKVSALSADSAIVLGRWSLQRKKDRPHGVFTLLFRHIPAGWRIVHDHTS